MFDFLSYIDRLASTNTLAVKSGFHPCTCSGAGALEGLLQHFRKHTAFICASDTCEQSTLQVGGAWVTRRLFQVWVLHRFSFGDPASYTKALTLCREVYRQFLTHLIHDVPALGENLTYLNVADVRTRELGGTFLNGCTGLTFMITLDEPTTLVYNPAEWEQTQPAAATTK